MTDAEKMVVLIAIASAKSCIHVFESAYPGDDRPRQALEAAEKWLNEPTWQNHRLLEALETRVWRSRDWTDERAVAAARACGCAARAARHPKSSALDAIWHECEARGLAFYKDPGRALLYSLVRNHPRIG